MSWSTGKDSAISLSEVLQSKSLDVAGLLVTITKEYSRVSMHATRKELLQAQAKELGLPIVEVLIPESGSNEIYERKTFAALKEAAQNGVEKVIFGDIFLEDIRTYRENLLKRATTIESVFPIWKRDTKLLAKQIIDSGFKAFVTCIDPKKLHPNFAGRQYDEGFLRDLPNDVDPCGENGEFHTFVFDGPIFDRPIQCSVGEIVERRGFVFADVCVEPVHRS